VPNAPDNHEAHDYAERIRERLPRRLQELRERRGLSKYGLARESGVSREYHRQDQRRLQMLTTGQQPAGIWNR
jgi:ribosome-binding protein aMBF1 (putative translation factor)